jgi:glycine/D-amino acid oxidase-like deaminating enzyme
MMQSEEVVVIGGGISGTAAAYELARGGDGNTGRPGDVGQYGVEVDARG